MKRKFLSTLLFGALACTTLSTVTSCKDYDDDINSLQNQIDALSKKIDDINTQITNGAILTSVTPTANGLTIALSNGKTYDITNGNDGKDGTAWTISDDGFWVKDGTKTTYKAVPADGKDGKDGADGKPGADGKDGKDGKYYVPNATTGNFDVVEDGKTTDSGISWKLSAVTGVMDNNVLTLYGIPNKEGAVDPNGVVINLNARLRGLVFAGDERDADGNYTAKYAKDAAGLPLLRIGSFFFDAQKLNSKDSENEKSAAVETAADKKLYNNKTNTDSLSYKTYAYYHVNPSNVNVDDLKKLSFFVQPNNELVTRAGEKAEKLAVGAEFVSYDSENGVVKVLLKPQGTPATGDYVSAIKLQSTLDDNAVVTSDAATLKKENVKNLRLAKKHKNDDGLDAEFHLRRASLGIKTADNEAGIISEAAWVNNNAEKVDLDLAVGETIDLNNIILVHEKTGTPCSVFDMSRLGLSVSYELVKNYKLGANKTDQANFIKLDGSKISPKVYDEQGNAAIGRTPIIRATLKAENGAVIEYAYIKVKIVEEKQADKAFTITPGEGTFKYDCSNVELKTTVKQMNVELYNKAGLSYDDFYATYTTKTLNPTGDDYKTNVGTVDDVEETIDGVPTKLLKWTLTPVELWANAGKEIQHVVLYSNGKHTLKLTLKATVSADGVVKEKNYTSADLINEYWKNGKAQLNVKVPAQDETGKVNGSGEYGSTCTFVNNLNAPFKTTNKKLELSKNATYSYYFCKDNAGETTIGGVKTKLAVADDGLTLKAQLWNALANKYDEAQEILKIDNNATEVYNTVTVQGNYVAKVLLNTGALEAKIGVKAKACFESTIAVKNDIKVTFNGEDHFTALFLRPLNVATKSATNFIDGVNFGNKGSWIKMKDLVNPTDWRGYSFTGTNAFLWNYYGVTDVTAVGEAECDLNGTRQALPATIELNKSNDENTFWDGVSYEKNDDGTDKVVGGEKVKKYEKDDLGFLTYKNNSVTVNKAFNIFVKVKVTYKWGVVESGFVTIPVEPTVGQ